MTYNHSGKLDLNKNIFSIPSYFIGLISSPCISLCAMCRILMHLTLDSKVLLDFDHVKNSLEADDESRLAPSSFISYKSHIGLQLDVAAFVVMSFSYDILFFLPSYDHKIWICFKKRSRFFCRRTYFVIFCKNILFASIASLDFGFCALNFYCRYYYYYISLYSTWNYVIFLFRLLALSFWLNGVQYNNFLCIPRDPQTIIKCSHLKQCVMFHTSFVFQEDIKIANVTIFVNPYTQPDEEEKKDNAKEKNAKDGDNVCSIICELSLADYFSHFCKVFVN